jgi:hypothetical protein
MTIEKEYQMTQHNDRILIHTEGQEGGFFISALSGQIITTDADHEMPEWAEEAIVNANLQERREYYTQRIGEQAFLALGTPDAIEYKDLGWVAADQEGDLVEIDADTQWRSENLANLLGIDTDADAFDKTLEGVTHEAIIADDYRKNPTEEETLAEAEGKSFEEVERQAVNG